jgi:hypothetical protein
VQTRIDNPDTVATRVHKDRQNTKTHFKLGL